MTLMDCVTCLVFASPLFAVLVITGFKMEGLMARPQRPLNCQRLIPQVDRNGMPVCMDPDGHLHASSRRGR